MLMIPAIINAMIAILATKRNKNTPTAIPKNILNGLIFILLKVNLISLFG